MACDADGQLLAVDAGRVDDGVDVWVGTGTDACCLYDGPSSGQEN